MPKKWDILGVGTSTVDDLLFMTAFPAPDTKAPLLRTERQGGGLIATALVAAARLGLKTAFGGLLGEDEASRWIEADLVREGVDVSPVVHHADTFAIHAYILVDAVAHTRTILYNKDDRPLAIAEMPGLEVLQDAHILMIDDLVSPDIMQLAERARRAELDVIADFEMNPDVLMSPWVNHLIISMDFALEHLDAAHPLEAAESLWHDQRDAVVITGGSEGAWYYTGGAAAQHQPAFSVDVVDTTGCGDVFHGAYAAALRWGWRVAECIRFASATAAMKASQPGGRQGIPTRERVEAFLKEYDS